MILVTGATGLVGGHLIQELAKSAKKIRAISNKSKPKTIECVEWINVDLRDLNILDDIFIGIETVYHCAAKVSFSNGDRIALYEHNVEVTRNIVNLCLKNKVRKLVYLSSVAVLEGQSNFLSENDIWETDIGKSNYAKTKYLAEIEVWRGIVEGLDATILLPSIILGFGDWNKSSMQIFRNVYKEFPFYPDGSNGFVDVKDVVAACLIVGKTSNFNKRYIINGYNLSWQQIFKEIAQRFNKKVAKIFIHKILVKFLLFILNFIYLFKKSASPLTAETALSVYKKIGYDNGLFLTDYPEFRYRKLENCLDEICNQYINNLK